MEKHKLQTIVNEVKETLPREKWSIAIKARINIANGEVPKPEPGNTEIDDYIRAKADRICEDHFSLKNRKVLISQFIRSKPQLRSVELDVKVGTITKNFEKGNLLGVIVAFKTGTGVRVGWSFYNKNHEVLPFSRRNAVRVAIIRGLTDGIIYNQTTSGIQIPNNISVALPDFVSRVVKYYAATPNNIGL